MSRWPSSVSASFLAMFSGVRSAARWLPQAVRARYLQVQPLCRMAAHERPRLRLAIEMHDAGLPAHPLDLRPGQRWRQFGAVERRDRVPHVIQVEAVGRKAGVQSVLIGVGERVRVRRRIGEQRPPCPDRPPFGDVDHHHAAVEIAAAWLDPQRFGASRRAGDGYGRQQLALQIHREQVIDRAPHNDVGVEIEHPIDALGKIVVDP